MPTFIPRLKLYASDGVTLLYTFLVVQSTNAPQTTIRSTEISGIRGQGSILITGSEEAWDLKITGIIVGTDYQDITSKIDAMESALTLGTKFILVFDKTPITSYSYHVIRRVPIAYSDSLRTFDQEYTVILRANSW